MKEKRCFHRLHATAKIITKKNNLIFLKLQLLTSASFKAFWQGPIVLLIKSPTRLSNFARVNLRFMCFGPEASIVKYGRLMSVCADEDNSILAFSAASFNRCIAITSLVMSIPCSFLNSPTR